MHRNIFTSASIDLYTVTDGILNNVSVRYTASTARYLHTGTSTQVFLNFSLHRIQNPYGPSGKRKHIEMKFSAFI